MDIEKRYESFPERLVNAIVLIVIGIVLLLNTTGYLPWDFWINVIKILFGYWPVLLIVAGINLIFKGSFVFNIILAGLSLFLFFMLFFVAYSLTTNNAFVNDINRFLPNIQNFNKEDIIITNTQINN